LVLPLDAASLGLASLGLAGLGVASLGVASLVVAGLGVAGLVLPVLLLPVLVLPVLGLLILSHRPAVAQKITPLHRRRPFTVSAPSPSHPFTVAPQCRRPPNTADAAAPIKSRKYQQTTSIKQQKAAP